MASRIDRVEREFVFSVARDSGVTFRLRAPGRSGQARLRGFDRENLRFAPVEGKAPRFAAGEGVYVQFKLHEQDFAFGGTVWKAGGDSIDLRLPEAIYRGLSRRWPRLPEPAGLGAHIFFPDAGLHDGYPKSLDFSEMDRPGELPGLDTSSLDRLVASFRKEASKLAGHSRVRMLREGGGPEDPAEELAARFGRILYIPSTWGAAFPPEDPWGDGRLITSGLVADAIDEVNEEFSTPLSRYIRGEAREGLNSFLVSPVLYYRSVVAFVHLRNGAERPRPLGLEAVETAWAFSRHLAWYLRRHGYFRHAEKPRAESAAVLDACPGGLQVALGPEAPLLRPGAAFDIRLNFPKGSLPCKARVTRRLEEGGKVRYGLSLEGLATDTVSALERGFYGAEGVREVEASA